MKFDAYASLFRLKTVGEDSDTIVEDDEVTLFTNLAKAQVSRDIVTNASNGANYFGLTLNADLVADQREYPFPDDVLKNIKMVEGYIDSEWRRLYPFDLSSYRLSSGGGNKPWAGTNPEENFSGATTDETKIADTFSDIYPKFDTDGRSIVIYSETIDTVSDGLKLKATIMPKDYVDGDWANSTDMGIRPSATTTAMPIQSHDIMLMKAVIEYKQVKAIPLTTFENTYFEESKKMIKSLSDINDDEAITATVERDTNNY